MRPASSPSNATAASSGVDSMPIRLGAVSYLNTRPLTHQKMCKARAIPHAFTDKLRRFQCADRSRRVVIIVRLIKVVYGE